MHYICTLCRLGKSFEQREMLEIHIAQDHLKHFPYSCDKCSFARFPTQYSVRFHCGEVHGAEDIHDENLTGFHIIPSPLMRSKERELKELLENCLTHDPPTAEDLLREKAKERLEVKHEPDREASPEIIFEEMVSRLEPAYPQLELGLQEEDSDIEIIEPDVQPEADSGFGFYAPDLERGMVEGGELHDEIEDGIPEKPSPEKKTTARSNEYRETVPCLECGELITAQRTSWNYHVNTRHLRRPIFRCLGCLKTWMTIAISDVQKHVQTCHKGNMALLEDNRKQFNEEIRLTVREYFPYKSPHPVSRRKRIFPHEIMERADNKSKKAKNYITIIEPPAFPEDAVLDSYPY
ncbi:hypothetical protein L596_011991 [Steinernema carpocapsae]|uniref:C2H2-type domain-containing protein n=1 Tax=Steinernema carpocapsae TaxID=34508 RepID=A0A4U5NWI2_STECR|nr:hypothetical protein L596_011991 [Steinernema carpocapsae]